MPPKSEAITTRARGLAPALRTAPVPLRRRVRRIRLPRRLTLLLGLLGPGLIAAAAGNDAGGVTTYSVVGAQYGYGLLWALLLIAVSLCIVQEMSARLGAVTGKGLADLKELPGGRWQPQGSGAPDALLRTSNNRLMSRRHWLEPR